MPNWRPQSLIPSLTDQEAVLTLLGGIATALPRVPYQDAAEKLLKQIGHESYAHACKECHEVPAQYNPTKEIYLCHVCEEENTHVE